MQLKNIFFSLFCFAATTTLATVEIPTSIAQALLTKNANKVFHPLILSSTQEVACPPNSIMASQQLNYVEKSDDKKFAIKKSPLILNDRQWLVLVGAYHYSSSQKSDAEILAMAQTDISTAQPALAPYAKKIQGDAVGYCAYAISNKPNIFVFAMTSLKD